MFEQEAAFKEARHTEIEQLQKEIEPLKTRVMNLMIRFLRDFPGEREDLEPNVEYLDSFFDLRT